MFETIRFIAMTLMGPLELSGGCIGLSRTPGLFSLRKCVTMNWPGSGIGIYSRVRVYRVLYEDIDGGGRSKILFGLTIRVDHVSEWSVEKVLC